MLSQFEKYGAPDAIVPVKLHTLESVKECILWLNEKYGFTRFCLDGLSKGHRATGYPTRDDYRREAKLFAEAREWIKEQGFSVGWFCCLTLKSGPSEYTPIIKADGSVHPFANCPLDEGFADMLSSDIAYYASIAHPDFIFLEDDFSISAAQGCFCERHLTALAEKCGVRYEREALSEILVKDDTESLKVRRAFAEVKRDSLVSLAKKIRCAMDEVCPEIPMGIMQSGASYHDGDTAEDIAYALAGEGHTPFIRLYGTFYCGFKAKAMPEALFNSLYKTEHMPKDILRYHESDTYPHMRYYTSGRELCALVSAAYSYGMVGSVFFAQQIFIDEPGDEGAYGKQFAKERARLRTLCSITKNSEILGVELTFDPFFNTLEGGNTPYFTECVGRLGIPFTTKRAKVAFWDERQAKYSDDEKILDYLSQGLILDGDAARVLAERGFGKYLGVTVGDPLSKKNPRLVYDLGASEMISEEFVFGGRKMWCGHAYCPAHGREWLEMTMTDSETKIVTKAVDSRGNILSPAMTYYENSLGGKVCVISQGMLDNHSQSIFNYRRAELLQHIVAKMSDEYPFIKGEPDVYMIAARRGQDTILTLINLCTDDAEELKIYLPEPMRRAKEILRINREGELVPLNTEICSDGIRLKKPLRYCMPEYVIIKGE